MNIPLTKKEFSVVDDSDFLLVSQYKWRVSIQRGSKYAMTSFVKNGKKITLLMHRLILSVKKTDFVDHIDHNGLNNTRRNLRLCSASENQWNQKLHKNNTSGYKGVSFHKPTGKFQALIQFERKKIHIGLFYTKQDAARAYNRMAKRFFGEFAYTNKIVEGK
jgi:AP2 domain